MDLDGLQARRVERRRQVRRRRTFALATLLIVTVALVIAVLASGSGSGSHGSARSGTRTAGRGAARAAASDGAARGGGGGAKPAPVLLGHPGTQAVPILMYHVIAAPPAGAPFPGLYVPPAEFSEQMQALASAGWHAVTQDQVEAYWRRGVSLGSGKPIVLSFDNGYQSQYTQALPVLRRLGWVGVENLQLTGLPPSQGGLGQEEIHGLVADGWELDTQGFSHAELPALDAEQLHYQVTTARQVIQQRYHVPANWFCYPSGHYDATVVAAVKAAGYVGATTVVPGWAQAGDDTYRLPRLRVLGGTTGPQLLEELAAIRSDPPAPETYTAS